MNGGSHFSTSEGRFAPVWGGGVEYAVTRSWTVRLEYDYADYGEKIIRGGYRQGAFGKESEQFETDLQLHMLEAAVAYKF
jgi:opacity protein-like surface antigen